MRTVELTEYVPSGPVPLKITERDTLRQLVPGLAISPVPGNADTYTLTGSSTVGVVRAGDLTVELRPKIGIPAVLFLVSYALDPRSWKPEPAELARDANLAEAIVPLFARTAQQALRPGLLHGYRQREDTLTAVRGRIRIADQFRSRTGLPLPVEVSYDDFTPDILENQLLRTAVDTIGRLYLRHQHSRAALARLRQELNGISIMPPDPGGVPEPQWTRLNERYRAAAGLARLIISTSGLEARAGGEDASVFLVNMNTVFERFVRTALREALRLDMLTFPAAARGRKLHLDDELEIPLEPDLSWWVGDHCVFAGDCKYKKNEGNTPNADVYQMLAYLTALRLPSGLLVYAAGEDLPRTVTISFAGKRVLIQTVDIAQEPANVLMQVAAIARLVRSIAAPLHLPEQRSGVFGQGLATLTTYCPQAPERTACGCTRSHMPAESQAPQALCCRRLGYFPASFEWYGWEPNPKSADIERYARLQHEPDQRHCLPWSAMNAHVAVGIRGSRSTTRPTPRLFAGRIAARLRELYVCPSGSHRRGSAALLTVPHVSLLYEYLGIQFVVATLFGLARTTRMGDGLTWSLLSRRMVCCDAKKAEAGFWLGR